MRDHVILVDEHDAPIGTGEKLQVHLDGLLHRAFSVFVVNARGEMLLQRRARGKYHSGGLWSNTCCSHPRPGEELAEAVRRRLREEMGYECGVTPAFGFLYRAELDHALIEHEYDHVFIGRSDADPDPDPCEVEEWRWTHPAAIREELRRSPEAYTYWFRSILERVLEHLQRDAGPTATRMAYLR